MRTSVLKHLLRIAFAITLVLPVIFSHAHLSVAQEPVAEVQWDQPMRIPSPEDSRSWFPDLAVDNEERVHVVWNETGSVEEGGEVERVYYSMWDGIQWHPFNDIVPPRPDIIRNSIAIDDMNKLHFVYGWLDLYYKQAHTDQAQSAAAWSSPHPVNGRHGAYMSDIAVSGDAIHVVYDDQGPIVEGGPCPVACADIFYRKSANNGVTWGVSEPLFSTEKGSARAQVEVDRAGTIHVTWDEGWDRLSGVGNPEDGVYTFSTDEGETWAKPLIVSYPNSTNAQLTAGSNGQGGVMLVWRTVSSEYPGIYFMWSTDQGESWSPPRTIPGILARGWSSPFDMYDMGTDSAGHIHLVMVGDLPENVTKEPPGVYHLVWDGKEWSLPNPVFQGAWYPEYPHLVVDRGNQLHMTWFLRQDLFNPVQPHQIWYAHGQSKAPAEIPVVKPTSTRVPTATSTPMPTPIPTPTVDPVITELSVPEGATDTIYTEVDDVLLLVQSLLPAILIVLVIIVGTRLWRR